MWLGRDSVGRAFDASGLFSPPEAVFHCWFGGWTVLCDEVRYSSL